MNISEVSIRNPVFAWMLMFALILFGLLSYQGLGISQNPDIDFPYVNIRVSYEGAAPEVIEKDIIDPIEGAIVAIQGIKKIHSTARNGRGDVSIEFELDKDIDVAVQEVQTQIARAQRNLPEDIEPPIVSKSNPEDRPILWLSISSDTLSLKELMYITKNQIQDRFTTVEGVAEVILGGYVEPALNVNLSIEKLARYELVLQDIISTIKGEHIELPAGRIEDETKERSLRVMGEAESLEEFKNIYIKRRGGSPNYITRSIKEVAEIEEGLTDIRRISRVNGEPSVGLGFRKQRGVNTVAVADGVKERMEQVIPSLPDDVKMQVNFDSTPFIRESVEELLFTLILSAILTSFVCWLFLGSFSSTVNILLAIPTSIIGTFIVLKLLGFTLNSFTLLALSLSIGVVVDDAILMLENIIRHKEMGKARLAAALFGSKEILFAVIATTAALIALFLPVAFMQGIVGKYFFEFAITISVAVAFSSIEALTLAPMRCSQFLSEAKSTPVDRLILFLRSLYGRLLPMFLRHRWFILSGSFIVFLLSLLSLSYLPKEFAPQQDESRLFIQLKTPLGSSLTYTDKVIRKVEDLILQKDYVDRYFLSIGGFGGGEVNSAYMFLTLAEPDQRSLTQQEIANQLRQDFRTIEGLQAFIRASSGSVIGGGRGFAVDFSVKGPNWDQLIEHTKALEKAMAETNYYTDLRTADVEGNPEIHIIPNRKRAVELGVEIATISETIQGMFGGIQTAFYTKDGQRYEIRVQLEKGDRQNLEILNKIQVRNNEGNLIPLMQIVEIQNALAPPSITREDRMRAISITANPADGISQQEALDKAEALARELLPEGYYIELSGGSEVFRESFQSLTFVMLIGLIVAYMVLASQFNSFIDPLIVFSAVPFAITGAFLSLIASSQSLNIYSFIGLILLMGISMKNSIVLVEFANQLRDQGRSTMDAILEACPLRLRPIIMTAISTVAAAVPAALNFGPGAETRVPMAVVIIGGALVSTFFTLFIVPCLYYMISPKRVNINGEVDRVLGQSNRRA